MEKAKTIFGVIPPLITPLTRDLSLDVDGLYRLIDSLIEAGVDGVFVGGTSGEACYLTHETQEALVHQVNKAINGRVPLLCGVIEPSTARCIERMRALETHGVDMFVATPAFYLQNSSQKEIVRHFEVLAQSTDVEIAVYNIPTTTHVNILPMTLKDIAEIDKIVLYKDSCADFQQLQQNIYVLEGTKVSMFNGAEELCAASMLFGAEGCVPGLANFFPKLFIDCCNAAHDRELETAIALQKKIIEIRQILFVGSHWMAAMKYLAQKFGFGTDELSLPLEPLSGTEKHRIDEMLERYT